MSNGLNLRQLLARVQSVFNRLTAKLTDNDSILELLEAIGPFALAAVLFCLLCFVFMLIFRAKGKRGWKFMVVLTGLLAVACALFWRMAWLPFLSMCEPLDGEHWLPVVIVAVFALWMMLLKSKRQKEEKRRIREERNARREAEREARLLQQAERDEARRREAAERKELRAAETAASREKAAEIRAARLNELKERTQEMLRPLDEGSQVDAAQAVLAVQPVITAADADADVVDVLLRINAFDNMFRTGLVTEEQYAQKRAQLLKLLR